MRSGLGPRRWIPGGLPLAGAGQRIGLLGGSFNPAHDGHLHVSRMARARLGLDQVWWLVSPQNPLKSRRDVAPLADRLSGARRAARSGIIRVTALEAAVGARYTVETVRFLTGRFRATRFVWLMGADNLAIFDRWKCWRDIAGLVPLAVIDRPGAGLAAVASPAARALARARIDEADARRLARARPPAWVLLHGPLSALSSTAIRTAA